MKEVRDHARELMKGFCRVCPVCNGKACASEVPGMGGLGTGSSFFNNMKALEMVRLRLRLVHDAVQPDTATSLLGMDLAMPVLAAPIGGVSFNMGGKISEEDYIDAVLAGCKEKGIVGCTGDGVPDFIHEAGNAALVKFGGIPFIKPWESDELFTKIDKAAAAGATIFGMDLDAAGLVTLRKMGRPVAPKSLDQLKEIVERTPGKFILKGVMTVEDARLAVEAGVDAIVVSNHGGRVLDYAQGTAEVLPSIAVAVNGDMEVIVDGGIRTGVDVLKMLALGADAVMIGRPFSIAAVGGLAEGVGKYLDQLRGELEQAMVLTGCKSVADINERVLA
ncbi:alpha-hydroxy-acid oxidizing protein [Desulfovibrio ferrophilus]|uniref:FMN-dependent alpha-hydroxy acid dehydrogenase n=1 Tax=Desulfovibrio ferrophilus TaxID=241368 RepID=A0A2Z6B035_9BACT|nr:alpha-hydroxy-acid oxidizing protein [Desulfovibrio ferrophilus]BBD08838.1 FMN-dependent alpha-hydroxy acid dehydrogenase [Desulfovibrio ferrophilus]